MVTAPRRARGGGKAGEGAIDELTGFPPPPAMPSHVCIGGNRQGRTRPSIESSRVFPSTAPASILTSATALPCLLSQ
jgi:hypothetical protein